MRKPEEKMLALIVEDSAVEAEIIKRSVSKGGYEVAVAHNGFEGLEAMMARKPAIVLSDINMPQMNGFEMCSAIKERRELQDTPVILISALSEPEDVIMAITAGADGYITKPYDEDTLLTRIEALITASRKSKGGTDEMMDIEYKGKLFTASVNYRRLVNILLSVYENLISQNHQLTNVQVQLAMLNEQLGEKVRERTQALTCEIEERIKTEEALKESEARHRAIMETANDAMICINPDGKVHMWNTKAEEIFGYTAQEANGKDVHDLVVPGKYMEQARAGLAKFSVTGAGPVINKTTEITALHRDGSEFPIELSIAPVKMRGGWGASAIIRDITERKTAEQALTESEAKFRKLFENSNDAIFIHTTDGRILDANSPAQKMTGYSLPILKAMPIPALHPPEELEASKKAFNETISKGSTKFESRFRQSGGGLIDVEISASIVDSARGVIQGIVRDITEQKGRERELNETNQKLQHALDEINKTQKMLVRAEKLAGLGQIAAGVAHELKNPLNIIYTSTQLMAMEEGVTDEVAESGKIIMEQVMRAVKIIDNLREFARERKPEMKDIDLCPFIEKTMSLVAYEIKGEGIEIVKECPTEPVLIMGDEDQLAQVFLNITNNARDSMNIRKKSYSFEEAEKIGWRARLVVRTRVEGGAAKISFEDNGVGIPEENEKKLFTPFFTTKGETTGTGLGIAIALGIIENHGGTIEFESEEGKGAVFTVTLPLAGA